MKPKPGLADHPDGTAKVILKRMTVEITMTREAWNDASGSQISILTDAAERTVRNMAADYNAVTPNPYGTAMVILK